MLTVLLTKLPLQKWIHQYFHRYCRLLNMPLNNTPHPDTPTELRDVSKVPPGTKMGFRTSYRNCHRLTMYGKHDNYTWGFRLYRTSYSGPNVDAEFSKAIEILHSYMREDIFYAFKHHGQLWVKKDPKVKDGLDDAPE
jgi:hypothetical protein